MADHTRKIRARGFVLASFLCYLAVVFVLVFYKGWDGLQFLRDNYASFETWKESVSYSLNLVPLQFLLHPGGYTAWSWLVNVGGNVALFVPMGIYAPLLLPKARAWTWRQFLLRAILLIAVLELAQLLLMCGQCDIDDLILNVSGMCIGFAFARTPRVREKLLIT